MLWRRWAGGPWSLDAGTGQLAALCPVLGWGPGLLGAPGPGGGLSSAVWSPRSLSPTLELSLEVRLL